VLNGIAFALCAGIVIGTYSSIFVTSALLVMWHRYQEKRAKPATAPARQSASASWDVPSAPLARAMRQKKGGTAARG